MLLLRSLAESFLSFSFEELDDFCFLETKSVSSRGIRLLVFDVNFLIFSIAHSPTVFLGPSSEIANSRMVDSTELTTWGSS
jgi:hypothetical protein